MEWSGVISETFSLWLKSPKKGAKSLFWALSTKRENAQDSDLEYCFGDLSQFEKLSEIKLLLPIHSKGTQVIIDYKSEQMLSTIDEVHSEK